jgi:nucleoside-diphosphate-sugar epimerase
MAGLQLCRFDFENEVSTVKIGVIGANGFLGRTLVERFTFFGHVVSSITRESYEHFKRQHFDVLVNADGNSKRYWANQNPTEDLEASVRSVYQSVFDFESEKYILISTSDVYPTQGVQHTREEQEIDQPLSPYGFNKLLAEMIVKNYLASYVILRCCAMIGKDLRKGVVKDIIDGTPLFVTLESRLQLITTVEVANVIQYLIDHKKEREVYNVAGRDSMTVKEIASLCGKEVKVRNDAVTDFHEICVEKLTSEYPLKSSAEYLSDFLRGVDS